MNTLRTKLHCKMTNQRLQCSLRGTDDGIIFNGPESHSLQVVYGQSSTSITIPDNDPDIYEKWINIKLKYDIKNKTLYFNTSDPKNMIKSADTGLVGALVKSGAELPSNNPAKANFSLR